jgi:GAF domain-containing protein
MTSQEQVTGHAGETVTRIDGITEAVETLARTVAEAGEFPLVLQQTCRAAAAGIPAADMASLTVRAGHGHRTVAATDEQAREADVLQHELRQGPCVSCMDSGRVLRADLVEARQSWPAFARAMRGTGIGSFLSVPLVVDRRLHGSLNLYGVHSRGFDRVDAALFELYTVAAEASLSGVHRYHEAREQIAQLERTLASRTLIDQAKGMIMATCGVDADEACTMLLRQCQREDLTLRELAAALTGQHHRPRWTPEDCR